MPSATHRPVSGVELPRAIARDTAQRLPSGLRGFAPAIGVVSAAQPL